MQRKELGKTLTRNDIVKKVRRVTRSLDEARLLTNGYFEELAEALVKDGKVKVYGLGTFTCRDKAQRVGRNPRSGEEKVIAPRRVVTFKASNRLKQRAEGVPDAETE